MQQTAYDGMRPAYHRMQAACICKWGQLHWITVCHCQHRCLNAERLMPIVCILHTIRMQPAYDRMQPAYDRMQPAYDHMLS